QAVLPVILGDAVFGLHKPARRLDAEKIQIVLNAAADEPAVAVRLVDGGHAVRESRALELAVAVTGVDVGQHVRCDQIAEAGAGGVGGVVLQTARNAVVEVDKIAADVAPLRIAEHADNPCRGELVVITEADGAEVTAATHAGID